MEKKQQCRGLNSPPKPTYFVIILNYQLTQKLKLIDEDKVDIISNSYKSLTNSLNGLF